MKLSEILQLKKFNHLNMKININAIKRKEIKILVESGDFELYQSYQKINIYKDTDYIIFFRAIEGRKAILHGIYKVNQVQAVMELPEQLQPIIGIENLGAGPFYYYDLVNDNTLNDLEDRLVIDWGASTVS